MPTKKAGLAVMAKPNRPGVSPTTATPSDATPAVPPGAGKTPIKITIGVTVITAQLADNATARDLVAQLPLSLTFKDFNQVEKIATLPQPLSMDGAPAGADPEIRDIGYYAPSGDLVFYYGHVGYWNGIVRIGRFDTTMELIEHQDDNFDVTIEQPDCPRWSSRSRTVQPGSGVVISRESLSGSLENGHPGARNSSAEGHR